MDMATAEGPKSAMPETFGQLLRRYRAAAGFSQEHLAGLARISVESVGALERGTRRSPYRETVALLAEALKLDPAERANLKAAADRGRARSARKAGVEVQAVTNPTFPLQTTSFVGRGLELASIATLLEEHRLVTVTGSGGVGKTRVVIEVAARLPNARRDEVRFVDLSPLNDGRFVVGAVSASLGISPADGVTAVDELVATLGSRQALIVLDNCEHLVADVALLVSAALRSCPNVSFLATSRERLAISGEVVYRLPSLEMPDRRPSGIEQARRYSAIELFVQRATMIDRSVEFADAGVDSLVAVCKKLDGIPLAIELVAARVSALGIETLRARLDQGLHVTGGGRNLPARQQTMFATIGWSYDLLDDLERTVLQRVSVFAGGFTLRAAEAVCAGESVEPDAVADILSSLVDKSLISVAHSEGHGRYSILDSVRSFARERLAAAGQAETLSLRHAEWLASFADWIDATRVGKTEPWLRAQTAPELENVRVALAWAFQDASRERALLAGRIVGGLRTIWLTSGRRGECENWAEAALTKLDEERDAQIAARLLRALVQAAQGDKELEWGKRAAMVFERVGDRMGTALLHCHLGNAYRRRGCLDEAEIELSRASELFADLPRMMPYTSFLQQRWQIHRDRGRYVQALSDIAEGIAIVNSLGDPDAYLWRLFSAEVRFAMGGLDEAIREAEAILDKVLLDGATYQREIHCTYSGLARFRFGAGDVHAGIVAAREALLCRRLFQGLDHDLAEAMHIAAIAAALRGDGRVAVKLWLAVETHYDRTAARTLWDRDRSLMPASIQRLALAEMDSLRAQGAAQPLDAIIDEALNLLSVEDSRYGA